MHITHYAARQGAGAVIEDHPHNAADRMSEVDRQDGHPLVPLLVRQLLVDIGCVESFACVGQAQVRPVVRPELPEHGS
jgi:hypothetical protein